MKQVSHTTLTIQPDPTQELVSENNESAPFSWNSCLFWLGLPFTGAALWYTGFIMWLADEDRVHFTNFDIHFMAGAPLLCLLPLAANLCRIYRSRDEHSTRAPFIGQLICFLLSITSWGLGLAWTYKIVDLPQTNPATDTAMQLFLPFFPLFAYLPQLIPMLHWRMQAWLADLNETFESDYQELSGKNCAAGIN